jgi:hypothetical protein
MGTLRQEKISDDQWSLVLDYPIRFVGYHFDKPRYLQGVLDLGFKIDFEK